MTVGYSVGSVVFFFLLLRGREFPLEPLQILPLRVRLSPRPMIFSPSIQLVTRHDASTLGDDPVANTKQNHTRERERPHGTFAGLLIESDQTSNEREPKTYNL